MNENEIGTKIIGLAISIHKDLGPGLFESVYETIMYNELRMAGFDVQRQVGVPIVYKGNTYSRGFRADLIVENKVMIELKAIETITKVHKKKLRTYLTLANIKLGYLINFNENQLREGITRILNGYL